MTAVTRFGTTRVLVFGSVLVLLLSTVLWWVLQESGTRITAYFDKAVGLYPDSSVRVLGIEVGEIERVTPRGGRVRVDMHVDAGVTIPADAKAVVVAPSLVSDRYIQLTPAYAEGPRMSSGATIPNDRTATPAELDELYRNVNKLSKALGPEGANKRGALSDLLDSGAKALDGNGETLNATVERLGELATTLSNSEEDLFATVDNLNEFTATLAKSDRQIRQFYGKLADVTGFLAGEREQVGAALSSLATALTDVKKFIENNRATVSSNVENLTDITQALVDQRKALAEVIDVAPLGASNFVNAYDAETGAIGVRVHINELTHPPVLMVCKLLEYSTPKPVPEQVDKACDKLQPVLDGTLKLPSVGETLHHLQQGELPPLPLPVLEVTPTKGTGLSGGE
ncbi:MCE family protein [Halopolyspora algeriensis]|uniref:MCE family protein n=1 Tax=Halopolyspora algeriensis TaxID=1500506 RepID=UPI003B82E834